MFGLQAAGLALVWVGYGFWLHRRKPGPSQQPSGGTRRSRALSSAGLFVLSAVLLLGGLLALQSGGGWTSDRFAGWAMAVLLLLGCAFVHLQILAAGILIGLVAEGVTRPAGNPSTKVEHDPRNP